MVIDETDAGFDPEVADKLRRKFRVQAIESE